MLITFVIPSYNQAYFIKECLDSILDQGLSKGIFEVIVIDGGSADRTVDILEKHPVVTEWVSEPDLGHWDALNKGIELATGDIIGILNSDDIFTDNFVLEKIAKFHLDNRIDASVGNITQFNKNKKIIRKYSAKNWHPDKLKIGFMPAHPSIFFKRDLFERYGNYKLDFVSGADYELIIRFFLKNKITWKFSNITTTSMLIGGISSSG